jgi:hypothetical protein
MAQILKLGSRNADVERFQISLNRWRVAHGRRKIGVDKDFGRETLLAVLDFQRTEQLDVDGKVGQNTWNKLDALLAAGLPPPPAEEGNNALPLVYDTTPENEIDPMEFPPNMRKTILEAINTYIDELAQAEPIRLTVSKCSGNGDAPVLTIQSAKFDYGQPAIIHTHYHGFYTSVGRHEDPHKHKGADTANIKAHLADDPQRVFVLPECGAFYANERTNWSNATDQARTTRDAIAAMGIENIEQKIVSAHSAGGEPLSRLLRSQKLDADEVRMLDCLYDWGLDWTQLARDFIQNNPGNGHEVVVVIADDSSINDRAQKIKLAGGNHVNVIAANTIPPWDKHHSTVVGHLR